MKEKDHEHRFAHTLLVSWNAFDHLESILAVCRRSVCSYILTQQSTSGNVAKEILQNRQKVPKCKLYTIAFFILKIWPRLEDPRVRATPSCSWPPGPVSLPDCLPSHRSFLVCAPSALPARWRLWALPLSYLQHFDRCFQGLLFGPPTPSTFFHFGTWRLRVITGLPALLHSEVTPSRVSSISF